MAPKQAITLAAFAALAFNGLILTFMGTSLPGIQSRLNLSIDQAGALMAMLQAGFTLFSLIGGILSDWFRRERILATGCLMLCGSCLLFGWLPTLAVNVLISCCMGAGIGFILSGSNTLLVSLYPERKGSILNIHHIFFGLGSLLGPLLMGYLLTRGYGWRLGLTGAAFCLFLLGLSFFMVGGTRPVPRHTSLFGAQVCRLFSSRSFLIIFIINGLAVGSQVTILLLGVTYLIQAKQSSYVMAGAALSLFSLFMMLGRLICSSLAMTMRCATIIHILLWLQTVSLLLAWYADSWVGIASLVLSGLAFSGIYPTSLALTGVLYPEVEGSALGILSTMGGAGSIALCWLTGHIAGLTDMQSGFIVLILACFTASLLFLLHHGALCRRESSLAGME